MEDNLSITTLTVLAKSMIALQKEDIASFAKCFKLLQVLRLIFPVTFSATWLNKYKTNG